MRERDPKEMLEYAKRQSLRYLEMGLESEAMTAMMSNINCDELENSFSEHHLEGPTCEGLTNKIIKRWIKGFRLP